MISSITSQIHRNSNSKPTQASRKCCCISDLSTEVRNMKNKGNGANDNKKLCHPKQPRYTMVWKSEKHFLIVLQKWLILEIDLLWWILETEVLRILVFCSGLYFLLWLFRIPPFKCSWRVSKIRLLTPTKLLRSYRCIYFICFSRNVLWFDISDSHSA